MNENPSKTSVLVVLWFTCLPRSQAMISWNKLKFEIFSLENSGKGLTVIKLMSISQSAHCIKLSLCSNGKILNFVYENNIRKLNNSRTGSAKTKELKIGIYSFCTGTYSIME